MLKNYGLTSLTSLNSPFAKVELIIEIAKVQKDIVQMEDNRVMAGIEEAMDDIRHGRVTGCVCNEMTAEKVFKMKKCSNSLYI